jgi:predicted nucleic acid-binding Zn ribbon protein
LRYDKGPQPIGPILDSVLGRLGPKSEGSLPPAAAIGTIFSRWEEIVGMALSKHAKPLKFQGGVLVIAVDQPLWATHIKALSAEVVDKIEKVTGTRPESLRVVVRR